MDLPFLMFRVVFCGGFISLFSGVCNASLRSEMVFDRLDTMGDITLEVSRDSPLDLALAFPGAFELPVPKALLPGSKGMGWRRNITATVFWVGEDSSKNNPVHNRASSWDTKWMETYGGTDSPSPRNRKGFRPASFVPKQSSFYVALPYNDIDRNGHKPEASKIIPWFWEDFKGPGVSVCHGRWVAIHKDGLVCYAKWRDCGPFTTDDWAYVFQGRDPKPNVNGNAGIDISPSVRDYFSVGGMSNVDWKFVNESEVPPGPWWDGETRSSGRYSGREQLSANN